MGAPVQIETIDKPEANNPRNNSPTAGGPTITGVGPGFCFRSQHPADILTNASFVAHFLSEVVLHIHSDGADPGLSENGAQGLYCILSAVEDTINEAVNRL